MERVLGTPLFEGGGDGRRLTETGTRLFTGIGNAFEVIDRAAANALRRAGDVRLSVLTTFATLWLVPRLPSFHASNPASRLLLATDTRVVDLASEPFDCAVRWGQGGWHGVEATLLFQEQPALVANPAWRRRGERLDAIPRIGAKTRPADWPTAEEALGIEHKDPLVTFPNRAMAVQAAVAGLGLTVIDRHLVTNLLQDGLLAEFGQPVSVSPETGHYFVASPAALKDRHVRALRQWLAGQATPSHAG